MLENLEVEEVEAVAPEPLARKRDSLPPAVTKAWDETPLGEARRVTVKVGIEADRVKIGAALLRLLQAHAKSQGLMAFKASAMPTDKGVLLYWQKKQGRGEKPEPAILPKPEVPKKGKPSPVNPPPAPLPRGVA